MKPSLRPQELLILIIDTNYSNEKIVSDAIFAIFPDLKATKKIVKVVAPGIAALSGFEPEFLP